MSLAAALLAKRMFSLLEPHVQCADTFFFVSCIVTNHFLAFIACSLDLKNYSYLLSPPLVFLSKPSLQMVLTTMWWRWHGAPPLTCPCWRCTSAAPVTLAYAPRWGGQFLLATWSTHPRSAWGSSATSPEVRQREMGGWWWWVVMAGKLCGCVSGCVCGCVEAI